MRFAEIVGREADNFVALARTGFYGKQGAGVIFLARATRRILLNHRSTEVLQPGTWGCWGGAMNQGETPEQAAMREAHEEAGAGGPYDLIPLYVFKKGSFCYYNFLIVVDDEFEPSLDWESQGYRWCDFGQWPEPLHFGLVSLFGDPASVKSIRAAMSSSPPSK